MKPYRKKNGEISYRRQCRLCYDQLSRTFASTIKNNEKRVRSYERKYLKLDLNNLICIGESKKCSHWVSKDGVIYAKYKKGFTEVKKRIGSRGFAVFSMNGKHCNYKRFVAQALIPNPKGCNQVFSKDGDSLNTHPNNLQWVWTRHDRAMAPHEALQRTKDKHLIEYYQTGDKRVLQRGINNVFEKMYGKMKSDLMGELYLIIQNYAERNLLFDLKSDIIGTYCGLIKQKYRDKLKTISIDSFEDIDKTNILYDYE